MSFHTRPRFEWCLRSTSMALGRRTRVMAIVNLTPDSFSGDGLLGVVRAGAGAAAAAQGKLALAAAVMAVDAGADIVDLGAESTRPGATALSAGEEQARLLPVLEALLVERPQAIVSVDTYHASTAKAAARAGAEIINDVSGLAWDQAMGETVAPTGCGMVLMHSRGRPGDWRSLPDMQAAAIVPEVFAGLCERLALAEAAGIASERVVVDPGFGFGKRGAENLTLLAGLGRLHDLNRPLLIGLSRKGFLGEAVAGVQTGPQAVGSTVAEERRVATIAAQTAAILAGAHVLRVHEVQAAREAAAVADGILENREQGVGDRG